MGQTLCHDVIKNGKVTTSCHFEEWYFFNNMFSSGCSWSNPAYKYGCSNDENDHLGLLLIHLVSFIMICIVYCRDYDLPITDFTRCYIVFTSIPMVMSSCSNFISVFNANFHWYPSNSKIGELIDFMKLVLPITTDILLGFTTFIFLIWAMAIAIARKEYKMCRFPVVHTLVLAATLLLGSADATGLIGDASDLTRIIVICIYATCFTALLVIPIVALSCSSPKIGQSPLPIVSEAKTRMILVIPFAILALSPTIIRISLEMYSRNLKGPKYRDVILHIVMLLHYLRPLFFAIAAISFLPQYRLCSKKSGKKETGKVNGDEIASKQVMTADMYVPSAPTHSAPVQSMVHVLSKEQFAAQRTNPTQIPLSSTQMNFAASCPPQPSFHSYSTPFQVIDAPPMYHQLVAPYQPPLYQQHADQENDAVLSKERLQQHKDQSVPMSQAIHQTEILYATVQNLPVYHNTI